MFNTFTGIFEKKEQLTHDVYSFVFSLPDGEIEFQPGQYVILHVPQEGADDARRLYSFINAAKTKDSIELLSKIIPGGIASEYFMKLKEGDKVSLQGPAGVFTFKHTPHDKVFVVAGTGIAPILSMIRSHMVEDKDSLYTLLWGLKSYRDLYYLAELKDYEKQHPGFTFKICLSREENLDQVPEEDRKYFHLGRVTTVLDDIISHHAEGTTDYYLCADKAIVEVLRQHMLDQGIAKPDISFEKFV